MTLGSSPSYWTKKAGESVSADNRKYSRGENCGTSRSEVTVGQTGHPTR